MHIIKGVVVKNKFLLREPVHVHKFGGSSLKSSDSFIRVANIVMQHFSKLSAQFDGWVVVSAAGKTTNRLIEIAHCAFNQKSLALLLLNELTDFQLSLMAVFDNQHHSMLMQQAKSALQRQLGEDVDTLKRMIDDCDSNPTELAPWVCFGEIWSARLMTQVLNMLGVESQFVDARRFITVQSSNVDFCLSSTKLDALFLLKKSNIKVVTGYIAADEYGNTVTLGRNGSDYSAGVCARLTSASKLYFWSDVSGVYSADPNVVKGAYPIAELSWQLADLLAHSGSSVLHNRTLEAVEGLGCEILLKNSMTPSALGTRIVDHAEENASIVSRINGLGLLCDTAASQADVSHLVMDPSALGHNYLLIKPEFLTIYQKCKRISLLFIHGVEFDIQEVILDIGLEPKHVWQLGLGSYFLISEVDISDRQYSQLHKRICLVEQYESALA